MRDLEVACFKGNFTLTLSVCFAVGKFVCDVNGGKAVSCFFVYD